MNDVITKLYRYTNQDISCLKHVNCPDFLKHIYVRRGIKNISDIQYSTNNLLSYIHLSNIQNAVEILYIAIKNKKKILIVGDFDVDGVTSTALVILALKNMYITNIDFIIPNRIKEGYGLSSKIVKKAYIMGAEIIITVDNGMSSIYAVELAKKKILLY